MRIQTRRRHFCAAAAVIATTPLGRRALTHHIPPLTDRPLFGAQLARLANGLRVAVIERRGAPVVAQYLFYGAGAGEDPPGRSGTAHFLEHMMFKGSPKVPPGAFSRRIAREGGQENAFTSRDVTAYFQHIEASRLPLVMAMEADRFASPLLPAAEIESERHVILEERRERVDSSPRGRFGEALRAALWGPQSWAGRPLIGWEEEIRAIGRADLEDFHRRFYAPGNAVLVIAGAVTLEEVRRLAAETYGQVAERPFPLRHRPLPPGLPHQPRLVLRDSAAREALLMQAWVAPSLTTADAAHALPLEVLAHLLGGGQGSRLHTALIETGLAASAGASYDADAAGPTEFTLWAVLRRGVAPAQLEEATRAVIAELLAAGPQEAEVARAIRHLTAGTLLALDSFGAGARLLGGTLAIGLAAALVEFWPQHIAAVRRAEVEAAARAVLGLAPSTSGWLLPEGG